MNDSAGDARNSEAAARPAEAEAARGGSSSGAKVRKPTTDHSTVITSSPPIPSPAKGDSASRILEGRVMPGDRIGHFDLIEYIGGGGMGRVYRAIDTKLGRTVALKVLPPEQAAADAVQRFQNEAQSAARLDHENVARVYYVGEDGGLPFIVFEFVEGVNVRSLVEQKGPLPLSEALSYTIQVTEALAHADARGVVHRDIKPSNVLITPEGRVKLIDMGLARLRNGDPAAADLTQSGVTLGTFDYISPEQARDPRNADIRSDIYSLGCTLFFMLAGHPPFPEGTVLQKLLQHQGDQPPDIRQFRPDVPEEASHVLRRMMAKDPRHRQGSSAELATELLTLAGQIGLRPAIPTSRVWLTPPEQSVSFFHRHLPWMAPVAALLFVVLAVDRFSRDDASPLPPLVKTVEKDTVDKGRPETIAADKALAQRDTGKADAVTKDLPRKDAAKKGSADTSARQTRSEGARSPSTFFTTDEPETPLPFSWDQLPESPVSPFDAAKPGILAREPARKTSDEVKTPPEAAKTAKVLVVSDRASGENEYTSLAAACNFARDGDVIELRFNHPREERPIRLSNQRVTVRAGDGYRPTIVFSPTEINPVMSPSSMFTLSAGQLTMSDVSLVLSVPRDVPADKWAVFETWGGQTIQLDRCSLTVCNASSQLTTYHQEVAFVRAKRAPDADSTVDGSLAATPLATVKLTDCIARGEGTFLCVEELQPVYLLWENGLLATTEQLLSAGGGPTPPKPTEMLRLELRHVTAAARGGLCRLSATSSNPHQLAVQFECTDDIIMTAHGSPLVEQEGTANPDKSREQLVWNGDHNFYQDVDVFWVVRGVDSRVTPEAMNFEDWKAHWGQSRENQPIRGSLMWRRSPNADQPLHAHTAGDYTLEDPTHGDASRGAPGFRADRLPPLPSESFQERSGLPATSVRGGSAGGWRSEG
jgi:eukaryotic-like serine/threonine-protein kinase